MEYRQIVLYFALALVAFALWNAWIQDYPAPTQVVATPQTHEAIPTILQHTANNKVVTKESFTQSRQGQIVTVHTDNLEVAIDTNGGNIIAAKLLTYPLSIQDKNPVTILSNDSENLYIAQSGLVSNAGPDTPQGQGQFTAAKTSYVLAPEQKQLAVKLTWQDGQGLFITKTFSFHRNDYAIHVNYDIKNDSQKPWQGNIYAQLRQRPKAATNSFFGLHTYTGAAISSHDKPYQTISYSKMEGQNLSKDILGGWLAIQQRYFLSAWVPQQGQFNHYYSSVASNDKIYTLGYIGPDLIVPPNSSDSVEATLYVGPEIADRLQAVAPHLELTVDYGWLWMISVAIFWVMKHIYNLIGNWGWAIILVTVLIKLLFYRLSVSSYSSMAKMRALQPKLTALKDRYGDNKQQLGQATMDLYRKEKVNPLGGCLPILIQIPVFIGLYYVLIESVELRQAPFIFWIYDLSAKDPYYVLPLLMGVTMLMQQKLNPTPPDPTQAKLMMLLPIVFTVFFLAFPSGLVLYWLTNNTLSILQQWHIMRRFNQPNSNK